MFFTAFSRLNKKSVALLLLFSFLLNLAWEVAQMPFYSVPLRYWHGLPLCCLSASFWDAVIGGGLYFFYRLSGRRLSVLLLLGFLVAVFIEERALAQGRWSYSPLMPLIPWLGVGLAPVLQMLILPFVSIKLTEKIYG